MSVALNVSRSTAATLPPTAFPSPLPCAPTPSNVDTFERTTQPSHPAASAHTACPAPLSPDALASRRRTPLTPQQVRAMRIATEAERLVRDIREMNPRFTHSRIQNTSSPLYDEADLVYLRGVRINTALQQAAGSAYAKAPLSTLDGLLGRRQPERLEDMEPGLDGLIKPGEEIRWTVKAFHQARDLGRFAARIGADTEVEPAIGKNQYNRGRVVGSQTMGGARGWRVDIDLVGTKGVHVNWWDSTGGADFKGAITITDESYEDIMRRFP